MLGYYTEDCYLKHKEGEMEFVHGDSLFIPNLGKCTVIDIFKGSAGSDFVKIKELKNNKEHTKYAEKLSEEIRSEGHKKFNHPVIFNAPREAYWFSIGFIARAGEIRLRTTPKTEKLVIRDYLEITGCDVDENYVIYNPNKDTFTDNALIIFNKPAQNVLDTLYFPENKNGKRISEVGNNKCEVYNKSFVWTLLSFGFRTGTDHDIDEIKLHLGRQPLDYIKAFNRGYLS